jgi:large subunit ribosomal protein L10
MKRYQKNAFISDLQQKLHGASAFYLTDFTGLSVKQMTRFRARLRKQGVEYVVVKNTLAKRAVQAIDLPDVANFFAGPTGVVIGREDAVAAAKAITDFAREFPDSPSVKVGVVDRRKYAPEQVKRLGELPSRDVLLGQVAAGLQAPLTQFVGSMRQLLAHTARALALLRERREREQAEAAGPAATALVATPFLVTTSAAGVLAGTPAPAPSLPAGLAHPPETETLVATTPQEINAMLVEELNEVEEWTLGVALRECEDSRVGLRIGARYTLALALGPAGRSPFKRATARRKESARFSIRTTLVLVSRDVELLADAPGFNLVTQTTALGPLWRATTTVEFSADAPPELPDLVIVPRSASAPELNVLLMVGNELYRDWVLRLHVAH